MTTHVNTITWAETGGTLVGTVEELSAGDTVSLALKLNATSGGQSYTPTIGDYFLLSNGGHAIYNGTTWVYTVAAGDATGNLSVAGTSTGSNSNLAILIYNSSGSNIYTLGAAQPGILPSYPSTTSPGYTYDVICFYPGTLIATPDGEKAVETLRAGDLVLTAAGKSAPVRWMGRQTVSTRFADPLRVLPIHIKAGALAEGVPARDLLVSPDHALLIDGVLIQAAALVNGVSIFREANVPVTFTYHHVELADHSLILAENTPAETFVDNVDRMAFDNWAEHEALADASAITEMDLPRAKATRQVPVAIRAHLARRATALSGAPIATAA
ncbi:Hint domain-containing protein [Acidocella sp.]|uniref:Hint domain-containing protein n=1 Tax=Acidocella sp. TaxID=50710 RepID=UPI00184BD928|nr:Hint domain-containing protein [Acidocella sp.]NNM57986.1 Hint domain-containing protein [Acidocella sp.]